MSKTAGPGGSLALTLIHSVVFLGFAAMAVAFARSELSQLRFALAGPFHSGTPPFWPAVLGAAVAAGAAAALLLRVVQRREVSMFISGAILAGFFVTLTIAASSPSKRSVDAANVALLEAGREVQRQLGARLQKDAEVPTEPTDWDEALSTALKLKPEASSPLRDRGFSTVSFAIVRVEKPEWTGQGARPGTLGLWISSDRAEFTITPLGLSKDQQAQVLLDDHGQPIRLRGVYNPDMH